MRCNKARQEIIWERHHGAGSVVPFSLQAGNDIFFRFYLTKAEIAALRKEDIDFDNKIIHVNRTLVYQKYEGDDKKVFHFELPKTKTSLRAIPMNKQCEIYLKKQYMQKNIVKNKAPAEKKVEKQFEDLLFTTKYNTPINSQIICDAIKKVINEINLMRDITEEILPFSCHCFRHTFATRCFEAGIQPKTVQDYLGHATLQMTMDLYTSVMDDHKKSEMERFNGMIEDIKEMGEEIAEQKYRDMLEKSNVADVIDIGDWVAV